MYALLYITSQVNFAISQNYTPQALADHMNAQKSHQKNIAQATILLSQMYRRGF